MFRTILSWLFVLPITALVVLFAISNRDFVTLSLFPLPYQADVPIYFLPMGSLLLGFLWGGLTVWLSDHKLRVEVREQSRRGKSLKAELLKERKRADELDKKLELMADPTLADAPPIAAPQAAEIKRISKAG